MLKRLVQICFVLSVVAGCTHSSSNRDAVVIEVILNSLLAEGGEVRFDPRPLKPDSRIHTLTGFAEILEEFEGRVDQPFLTEDTGQIEASRRQIAAKLGIGITNHTEDDNCAGMLKPVQPDQMAFVYSDCPDSSFRSVIYSTVRDVEPDWVAPNEEDPSQVKVVRGVELLLTPKGMFSRSMDYYVEIVARTARLIDQKLLVIME